MVEVNTSDNQPLLDRLHLKLHDFEDMSIHFAHSSMVANGYSKSTKKLNPINIGTMMNYKCRSKRHLLSQSLYNTYTIFTLNRAAK